MTRAKVLGAVVLVAIAACSEEDQPGSGQPPGAEAKAVLDHKGGELRVAGAGPVGLIRLALPAGALQQGEQVTLTLKRHDKAEAYLSKLRGPAFLFGLSLEISPESMAGAVHDNLEAEFEIDPQDASLSAEQRALLAKEPLKWAKGYLLHTKPAAEDDYRELTTCTENDPKSRHDIRVMSTDFRKTRAGNEIENGVVLAAPVKVLKLFGALRSGRWFRTDDGWFHSAALQQSVAWPHKHAGLLSITYFPMSTKADQPEFPLPQTKADRERVWHCLQVLFSSVADTLSQAKFKPIAVNGGAEEFEVVVYDFTGGSTIAAASYSGRYMQLSTNVFDPARWGSKNQCLTKDTMPIALAVAHEMFHWQQGAYLSDQNVKGWWWQHKAWNADQFLHYMGNYKLSKPQLWGVNDWISEGTAHYFAYQMVREHPVEPVYFRHGLTGYPLDRPAWFASGSALNFSPFWAYPRVAFFKYLLDKEDSGAVDELARLRGLMEALAKDLKAAVDKVPKTKANEYPLVNLAETVRKFGDKDKRDWFGFFREFSLLRGCTAAGKCPKVDQTRARPYARLNSKAPDLFGVSQDAAYWSALEYPEGLHEPDEEPYLKAHDGYTSQDKGASQVNSKSCRFDTVKQSVLRPAKNARQIAENLTPKSEVELTLPHNVQFHQAGVRVELLDNLEYQEKNRYSWVWKPGSDCSPKLQAEAWQRTDQAGSLRFLAQSDSKGELAFVTEKLPKGAKNQYTSLLIGNTAWKRPVPKQPQCKGKLSIKLNNCPCDSMPLVKDKDKGGPDDVVLHCVVAGKSNAFCDHKGFLAAGLLSALEWEQCYKAYAAMGAFCKLSAKKP